MSTTAATSETNEPELVVWDMQQLLDRLPVGRATVYRLIDEGLPVVRVTDNSAPLFIPASVCEWFRAREQRSESAAEAQRDLAAGRTTARGGRGRRQAQMPPPPVSAGTRKELRRIRAAH